MSRVRSPASAASTRNGMATKVSARIAPSVENGSVTPRALSNRRPSGARRPKASSSATPPTTGGSTAGTVTSARRTARPGSSARARNHASGTPRSSATPVAERLQMIERPTASPTSAVARSPGRCPQSAWATSPRSGSRKSASPATAGTTNGQGGATPGTLRPARPRSRPFPSPPVKG